jgi:hypothetical protein
MTDEATIPNEDEVVVAPEDPICGPDGVLDCIDGRFEFIAYWLAKLGVDDPSGSALTFGEGCSVAILHPETGEWMTPAMIVKLSRAGAKPTLIQ